LNVRVKRGGNKVPWNKGKQPGQKLPLSLKEVRTIRRRLNSDRQMRELVLFSLAIESNLSACDLVRLRVRDVGKEGQVASQATLRRLRTNRPVQFAISEETRIAIAAWIARENLKPADYLFPSRLHESPHLSTRQYARIVASWVNMIGLDPNAYGTESLRRTSPMLLYRTTRNVEAVQGLLGHVKRATTARYLGITDEA
jgi:integrase